MVKDKTLYDRLEISQDATQDEIKKAGTKLSLKWHPDKNLNNVEEATQKFKEVREAVEILGDESKRRMYDQFGFNSNSDFNNDMPIPDFQDLFSGMGMFNMKTKNKKNQDIIYPLKVSLEQVFKEESLDISYDYKKACDDCIGEGGRTIDCTECKGKGMTIRFIQIGPGMAQQSVFPCMKCEGKGKRVELGFECVRCQSKGYVMDKKTVTIHLKKYFSTGMKHFFKGHGHLNNDFIVVYDVEEHPIFSRKEDDLFMEIELTLYEAIFGFSRKIVHLDGNTFNICHVGKTEFGTYRKILDKGMTNERGVSEIGDLIIHFTFTIPDFKYKNECINYINMNMDIKDINMPYEEHVEMYDMEEYEYNEYNEYNGNNWNNGNNGNNEYEYKENVNHQQQCRPM